MNEALEVLAAQVQAVGRRLGLAKLSAKGRWACFIVVALGLVISITLAATWDDIMRTQIDTKEPFQTYKPPPAPNYALASAWALIPPTPGVIAAGDPPADIFFIHPTTFDGGRDWNGPIDDPATQRLLEKVMLPNYAGPFLRVGRVFAPHYRQASLYAHFTLREDARAARAFAYGDVLEAFRFYLAHYNQGRPIILVGVEQGGLLGDRLLREVIDRSPDLVDHLAAAYLIDAVVPSAPYEGAVPTPACARRAQAHCVLAWRAVEESDPNKAKEVLDRALVWTADDQLDNLREGQALCVNPLLGAQTTDVAPARANLGAANATELEWGVTPPFLPRQVSAQCLGGILRFSHPRSNSLKPATNWPDKYKVRNNNLFFADIEADAMKRVATYMGRADFPVMAAPIDQAISVQSAPVHKID